MKRYRLQLGASRLEKLSPEALEVFLDKSWIHLGDKTLSNPNNKPLQKVDYSKTNFDSFYFKRGGILNFSDDTFDHIYSEHFFEHLFLDESIDLLKECYRVLKNGGFIRIVVPDADLRPIPEKIGFPGEHCGYEDPRKHKMRWSIYSLESALQITGFATVPIRYYDRNGTLHDYTENLPRNEHFYCADKELVSQTKHIKRKNSLILDGTKK